MVHLFDIIHINLISSLCHKKLVRGSNAWGKGQAVSDKINAVEWKCKVFAEVVEGQRRAWLKELADLQSGSGAQGNDYKALSLKTKAEYADLFLKAYEPKYQKITFISDEEAQDFSAGIYDGVSGETGRLKKRV